MKTTVSITEDGRLRIPTGTRICLPDDEAAPGFVQATTYNHTVTVAPRWRDVMPVGPGLTMVAWGKPSDRRAVIVSTGAADQLGL